MMTGLRRLPALKVLQAVVPTLRYWKAYAAATVVEAAAVTATAPPLVAVAGIVRDAGALATFGMVTVAVLDAAELPVALKAKTR